MGSGIAQVCASSGYDTIIYELLPSTLQKAKEGLQATLLKLEEKGKLPQGEREKIFQRSRYALQPSSNETVTPFAACKRRLRSAISGDEQADPGAGLPAYLRGDRAGG